MMHAGDDEQQSFGIGVSPKRQKALLALWLGRIMVLTCCMMTCATCAAAVLTGFASADAVVGAPPTSLTVAGLPDGRSYEEVSPPNKYGNFAGASAEGSGAKALPATARADGNALFYSGHSEAENSVTSMEDRQIAERTVTGWRVRPIMPRALSIEFPLQASPNYGPEPSADLSHTLFVAEAAFTAPGDQVGGSNIYLAGENWREQPAWIGKPTTLTPDPAMGSVNPAGNLRPIGGSSDFKTVYFEYAGTLTPEDTPRTPYLFVSTPDWGLYQWTASSGLLSAGVLPDGSVSPFGARLVGESAIGGAVVPATVSNEVSANGSRAFFVSPDPGGPLSFCEASKNAGSGGCTPQLYVRETTAAGERKTTLLSRDVLLSGVNGLAQAPSGVLGVFDVMANDEGANANAYKTYAYAPPDGSRGFFESTDRLTSAAPSNGFPKEYQFNTLTSTLTYLSGVTDGSGGQAPIVASSNSGDSFMFVKTLGEGEPKELDLWVDGPGGGTVRRISQLPAVSNGSSFTHVDSARGTNDGSAFVFSTNSPLPGGFNNKAPEGEANGVEEVYRYDVASNTLDCVSCPPVGISPTGSAVLSHQEFNSENIYNRGISTNADRIFFDTPDPLVPRDVNGVRDVYEWENGAVYLISSGTGLWSSFFLDNSAEGEDVFFATADSLAASDTDGGYDVYDARIRRQGDSSPPPAAGCQGDACQGPVSLPPSPSTPASTVFSGPGNLNAPAVSSKKVKPLHKKSVKNRKHTKRRRKRGATGRFHAKTKRSR